MEKENKQKSGVHQMQEMARIADEAVPNRTDIEA